MKRLDIIQTLVALLSNKLFNQTAYRLSLTAPKCSILLVAKHTQHYSLPKFSLCSSESNKHTPTNTNIIKPTTTIAGRPNAGVPPISSPVTATIRRASMAAVVVEGEIAMDERQIIDEKLTLVDDDGKPLPKVVSTAKVDSDSEVKDVVDDHAVFMAPRGLKRGADSGYDTNNLLEQWMTTKRDDDYDPYDDDFYESHNMSGNIHAICDDFDITVCDRKKK
ncbi:hypothetical protein Tco_1265636 [Tanacetum coccineum]